MAEAARRTTRGRGGQAAGELNRSDESAGGTRQGVKIRALRERLIKGCKLTGANDVAVAPSKLRA